MIRTINILNCETTTLENCQDFYFIKMETVKDIIIFCNAAVFYVYTNIGITCELNQVRKC